MFKIIYNKLFNKKPASVEENNQGLNSETDSIKNAFEVLFDNYSFDQIINDFIINNHFEHFPILLQVIKEKKIKLSQFEEAFFFHSCSCSSMVSLIFIMDYKKSKNETFQNVLEFGIQKVCENQDLEKIEYILNFYNVNDPIIFNYTFFELFSSIMNTENFKMDSKSLKFYLSLFNKTDEKYFNTFQNSVYESVKSKSSIYYLNDFWKPILLSKSVGNF